MDKIQPVLWIFAALSLLGYFYLASDSVRRGAQVQVGPFSGKDLFLVLVLSFLLFNLGLIILRTPPDPLRITTTTIWQSEALYIGVILVILLAMLVRKMPVMQMLGLRRYSLLRVALYAAALLLLTLPLVTVVSLLLPHDQANEQQIVALFRQQVADRKYGGVAIIAITGAIAAPVVEEFLFRGYLYPVLKKQIGPIASAVITSALFAWLHGNLQAMPGLALLALALTFAYEWSGSLLVPIGMHALFNGANLLFLASQPTPP